MGQRIKLNNHSPFGVLYAALIGGAVLLIGGYFLCWILAVSRVRTAPRTFTTMAGLFPMAYYFALAALVIGLVVCASVFLLCAARWVRGARFSLAELVASMLAAGIALCFVLNYCMSGVLAESSKMSWLIAPVLGLFNQSSNYLAYQERINIGAYASAVLASLLFAIPLCGRHPERSRVARYVLIGMSIFAATGFGSPALALPFGALSIIAVTLCGVSDRLALAALFSRKKARTSLPLPPSRATLDASEKSGTAARAGV